MKRLQIGMDTYKFDTESEQLEAIKSVVIYHQGQLSTMKIIQTAQVLSDSQEAYISYNMMDAATTTADEDMPGIEIYFVEEAQNMGPQRCEEWMEEELGK